jgi:hypothetical protein
MCLGLAVFQSTGLAQDEPILCAQYVNKSAHFQIWRTITLGTYKCVDAYRRASASGGIRIGDSANEILGRPAVPYARMKTEMEIAVLSVVELGVKSKSSLSDVQKLAQVNTAQMVPGPPRTGPAWRPQQVPPSLGTRPEQGLQPFLGTRPEQGLQPFLSTRPEQGLQPFLGTRPEQGLPRSPYLPPTAPSASW